VWFSFDGFLTVGEVASTISPNPAGIECGQDNKAGDGYDNAEFEPL
jgi:hypothetical protein